MIKNLEDERIPFDVFMCVVEEDCGTLRKGNAIEMEIQREEFQWKSLQRPSALVSSRALETRKVRSKEGTPRVGSSCNMQSLKHLQEVLVEICGLWRTETETTNPHSRSPSTSKGQQPASSWKAPTFTGGNWGIGKREKRSSTGQVLKNKRKQYQEGRDNQKY